MPKKGYFKRLAPKKIAYLYQEDPNAVATVIIHDGDALVVEASTKKKADFKVSKQDVLGSVPLAAVLHASPDTCLQKCLVNFIDGFGFVNKGKRKAFGDAMKMHRTLIEHYSPTTF